MAKSIITSEELGALHDVMKAEYSPLVVNDKEVEGKYLLKADPVDGYALENVTGLRNTVGTLRGEVKDLTEAGKKYEGVDLEEHQRLVAKKAELDAWDPSNDDATKQRIEEANHNWQKKYDTDIGEATNKADTADGNYRMYFKTQEALKAAAKHALPDCVELVANEIVSRVEVYRNGDGKDTVFAKGSNGHPQITAKPNQTGNMDPEELVLALAEMPGFKRLFPGSNSTGSGAVGGGESKGSKIDSSLSPTEKLKAARRLQSGG